MKIFTPVPLPKFGREPEVDISELIQLKSVIDGWKSQMQDVKGAHGDKIRHSDYTTKPKITTFQKVESRNAVLLPVLGGKFSI